jgi:hypothetical protein
MASSASPVAKTRTSGLGSTGGTMAIRSFFIGVKCDIAVNANIAASDTRADTSHESNASTPATPSNRQTTSEPNKTIKTAI